jgi:hypothetical protein
MDPKVGDCVCGAQCSISAYRNSAGHQLIKTIRHPNMFQPLKGHLQGIYLIDSSSKFNKTSKIQLSVVAFFILKNN